MTRMAALAPLAALVSVVGSPPALSVAAVAKAAVGLKVADSEP